MASVSRAELSRFSRGVFKVNPGSLLTAFQRLERLGWLDSEWSQTDNSRRAKFYSLTRLGKKQLEVQTAQWKPPRLCDCAWLLKAEGINSMSLWRQIARGVSILKNRKAARPGYCRRGRSLS